MLLMYTLCLPVNKPSLNNRPRNGQVSKPTKNNSGFAVVIFYLFFYFLIIYFHLKNLSFLSLFY